LLLQELARAQGQALSGRQLELEELAPIRFPLVLESLLLLPLLARQQLSAGLQTLAAAAVVFPSLPVWLLEPEG
jgi:hypothetical protein